MNRIDYNQTGGFPLSTQILEAAQEAYKTFNQYGYLAGNNMVIITGCEPAAGGTVTDGFVAINGELLPFVGSTVTDDVIVVETADARGFEDGSVKPVIYSRYATFGSGDIAFPWVNFRRPMTLFALEDRLIQLERAVPVGLVAIWDRPAEEIPLGWVEHTDLAGRTAVGHLDEDVNFGALGGNLGAAQVELTKENLPNTRVALFANTTSSAEGSPITAGTQVQRAINSGGDGAYNLQATSTEATVGRSAPLGSGTGHSNIQPSRIVKYIRFVGFN